MSIVYLMNPEVYVIFTLQDMVRDDIFYCDIEQIQIATRAWDSKFKKSSEHFNTGPAF